MALSSNCTADPFTADGTTCAPAAVNAAFDTFTTAGSPQRLFSQALTGGPNCVLFYQCRLEIHVHHHRAKIIAKLRQRYFVGIVVDKVGKHGAKRVGRVPLGTHPRSTLHLAWDLKVNGKPLARRALPRHAARPGQEGRRARPHPAGHAASEGLSQARPVPGGSTSDRRPARVSSATVALSAAVPGRAA